MLHFMKTLIRSNYGSLALGAVDIFILTAAVYGAKPFDHGEFFSNANAWRFGALGAPLAFVGIIVSLPAVKNARGFTKLAPLAGLILCLLLAFNACYEFVLANTPGMWPA